LVGPKTTMMTGKKHGLTLKKNEEDISFNIETGTY
jgi:hypothetical protein